MQGPDFEGQIRRLRTSDGVYFTKAGAVKIASYVDRELRRGMPSYVAPVALPGSEPTPKSGPARASPDVGPVLPLTSSAGGHASELLGGKDQSTRTTSDSIAAKVLSRGETSKAPRSEEHTSELQSLTNLVCRLLLEKKNSYDFTFSR